MKSASSTEILVERICAAHDNRPDALIEILHDLQAVLAHVPAASLPLIAAALNLSRAEVFGVVSFYKDFRDEPPSGRVIKLCRAEACQAMGCDAVAAALDDARQAGAALEVETVYCLGNCALAPAALMDERLIGRVTAEKLLALLPGMEPAE